MIPTRIKFFGDKDSAKKLVGLGNKVLNDLQVSMGFQTLKTGSCELVLADGSVIKAIVNYKVTNIEIYTPEDIVVAPDEKEEFPCFCGVAIGNILTSPADDVFEPFDWVPVAVSDFTVSLEQKNGPKTFYNIKGSDKHPYRSSEPDDENNATRSSDNVIAIIQEADTFDEDGNLVHTRLEEISPCSWDDFTLISIEF